VVIFFVISGLFTHASAYITDGKICGDGICEQGENCSTCFLDCGTCGFLPCMDIHTDCNGNYAYCATHGTCNQGVCDCTKDNWYGPACELHESIPLAVHVDDKPPVVQVKLLDTTAKDLFNNVSFQLRFKVIQEISYNGTVIATQKLDNQSISAGYNLNWLHGGQSQYVYEFLLPNQATLQIVIIPFEQATPAYFANTTTKMPADSFRTYVAISDWPFKETSSNLRITMRPAHVPRLHWHSVKVGEDKSEVLLWYKRHVQGSALYAKFQQAAQVDSLVRSVQFMYKDFDTVGDINVLIPHFERNAEFVSDYQILVESPIMCLDPAPYSGVNNAILILKIGGFCIGVGVILVVVSGILKRQREKRMTENYRQISLLSMAAGNSD